MARHRARAENSAMSLSSRIQRARAMHLSRLLTKLWP